MTTTGSGPMRNGPWWSRFIVQLGVSAILGFLVLYLLGAIPLLPSPIDRLDGAIGALRGNLADHNRTTDALLRAIRQACRGTWRGNPDMQEECDR